MSDQRISRIHFIGIGGVGMSGIAKVAHDQGIEVSGSDLRESRYTEQLREAGVRIFIGQAAENISSEHTPDIVVVSTAILPNNPELIRAQDLNIPIWHRARMLAYLGRDKKTLAVAGTHGKTTTSSMLASALSALKCDPTFLIGGIVREFGTNAHSGSGAYYAVEADESDKSFTYLDPFAVLVTNIEPDHLDHYSDLAEIESKFSEFMSSVHEEGSLVVCADDERLVSLARETDKPMVTYGFSDQADYHITAYTPQGISSSYTLKTPDGRLVSGVIPQNPGKHNVSNATGVIALLDTLGINAEDVAAALSQFAGVRRRFDLVGRAQDITIVDDYAHHPTEVQATITAASKLGYNRVVVLFQPHRYSRVHLFTEVLHDEFAHAFDNADEVCFMDVYAAGETPVPGVNGKTFMNVLLDNPAHPPLHFMPRRQTLADSLVEMLKPGDLFITMGAGDVTSIGPEVLARLNVRA